MDERRKIIIPIGADPDSKSEQTYFDTQSRKDARPVVPLSEDSTTGPAVPAARSRKRMLFVVILVAAVAAAGTAGAYAYISQSREQAGPQTAVQPVAGKALSTLSWTHTSDEPGVDENTTAAEQARDANADGTTAQTDRVANDGDSKKASKKQKRGKTGNKNTDDNADDPVKRTQDELHRIREIFEGPP
jgi:hypothetical protein